MPAKRQILRSVLAINLPFCYRTLSVLLRFADIVSTWFAADTFKVRSGQKHSSSLSVPSSFRATFSLREARQTGAREQILADALIFSLFASGTARGAVDQAVLTNSPLTLGRACPKPAALSADASARATSIAAMPILILAWVSRGWRPVESSAGPASRVRSGELSWILFARRAAAPGRNINVNCRGRHGSGHFMIDSVDQESLTPSYSGTPRRGLYLPLGPSSGAKLDKGAYESSCGDHRTCADTSLRISPRFWISRRRRVKKLISDVRLTSF